MSIKTFMLIDIPTVVVLYGDALVLYRRTDLR